MTNKELFTTVHTEGGLLPSDLLQAVISGDADLPGLTPASYHLAEGERLNELISRSWNRLLGAWANFRDRSSRLPEDDPGTTLTREKWLLILFQELGYGRLQTSRAFEISGKSYPVSHFWKNSPIHLVGCRVQLDRRTAGIAGAARFSPHGLVQEFLNRSPDYLWGFVSNGLRLRLLRDNLSLTRQAYLEFDLEGMMEGEVYSDFVLLWLLSHQSRVEAANPRECWLERWVQSARERGVRALDHLRHGVQAAIQELGSGFLAHPANAALRERLRSGELSTLDYYRQVLRLVYRLIFIFVAEDREMLLDPAAPPAARNRYLEYYSAARLRRLASRRRGTRHPDLYRGLRVVMEGLGGDDGLPGLALPALGSFLWSAAALPDLASAEISNLAFLEALRALAFRVEEKVFRSVDYRNMGAEELGSVYESLLELHPRINLDSAAFSLETVSGHERKTTGSYYTPDSLVRHLLDTALDPILERAASSPDPQAAILELKICDPATGSGHFLIAAAHRIARKLASVRTGDDEPSPEALHTALRDVIGRCLYGVDINPMSVELCKVSLWLEAIDPGKPLSFLDHHIRCGNSLLGTTPALLDRGLPDEAFQPVEGDDKKICSAAKKKNREENSGQLTLLYAFEPKAEYPALSRSILDLNDIADDRIQGVKEKARIYDRHLQSPGYLQEKRAADAWCAAFVWEKNNQYLPPLTQSVLQQLRADPDSVPENIRAEVRRLAEEYRFFHWHLAFPDVFTPQPSSEIPEKETTGWTGGFDCVLGNPPWEHTELKEREFFASRDPEIAEAKGARRKKLIKNLEGTNPELFREYIRSKRTHNCVSHLVRSSARYPLTAQGRINLYAIFAGLNRSLINSTGSVGCILPSGIATDNNTKDFFADLVLSGELRSLYDFENRQGLFSGVHRSYKFCLLTLARTGQPPDFVFFAQQVSDLSDPDRHFQVTPEEFALLNPNTLTCPIFRGKKDAELTKHIYRRVPVLIDEKKGEEGNPWKISFKQGLFNMTSDSHLFRTREELEQSGYQLQGNVFVWPRPSPPPDNIKKYLPLYEGKMFWHFTHRWANADDTPLANLNSPEMMVIPRYWVSRQDVENSGGSLISRGWMVAYRWITNATNERTFVAALVPAAGFGNSAPIVIFKSPNSRIASLWSTIASSFVFDYSVRQKLGGTNLTFSTAYQLPWLLPDTINQLLTWCDATITLGDWLLPRVLELTYTARDLEPFARDCGYTGPPFKWDEERRFQLRCELDAAFFHLYLPSTPEGEWKLARREEGAPYDETDQQLEELKRHFPTPRAAVEYIMDTFPIVKRKDEAAHNGEYRTKTQILKIYDQLQSSLQSRTTY